MEVSITLSYEVVLSRGFIDWYHRFIPEGATVNKGKIQILTHL
jgi:hypothetical protein